MEVKEEEQQSYVQHYFELPSWSDTPAKKAGEFDLPILLSYSGSKEDYLYLRKLQLLSSFAHMHHASLSFLDELISYQTEALKTAESEPFYLFATEVTDDDKDCLEGGARKLGVSYDTYIKMGAEENRNSKRIHTPEGHEALIKLVCLSKSERFTEKNRDHVGKIFAHYENSKNSEVHEILQRTKNSFYNNLTHRRVASFAGSFLFSLQLVNPKDLFDIKEDVVLEEALLLFHESCPLREVEEFLKESSMREIVMDVMPQIPWLYAVIDALNNYYDTPGKNIQKTLTTEESKHFLAALKQALDIIRNAHRDYNSLYKSIFEEQNRILKNYPGKKRAEAIGEFKSHILHRPEFGNRLPDMLPNLLHDNKNDKHVEQLPKQKKKNTTKKKGKKSKSKRKH